MPEYRMDLPSWVKVGTDCVCVTLDWDGFAVMIRTLHGVEPPEFMQTYTVVSWERNPLYHHWGVRLKGMENDCWAIWSEDGKPNFVPVIDLSEEDHLDAIIKIKEPEHA